MAAKVDPQRQIRQMVNFIMQEAHEKVNEIKIKTEHDFTLERQNLVHHGKIKIQEEYAQKEKDLEIQQRVSRSNAIGESRVKKMKARDDLLQKLKKEALERLEGFTTTPQYSNMIKKLIIQGLIKMEEAIVEVQYREADKATVSRVLPEAVQEYKQLMASAGVNVNVQVSLAKTPIPNKSCSGGIILTAHDGKIVLNQTSDERLSIVYDKTMPQIRQALFSKSA